MRSAVVIAAILLTATVMLALRAQDASEGKEEPPAAQMKQYVVGLIYQGADPSTRDPQEVMKLQRAHLENIDRLIIEGKMALAGPFADGGDLRGLFFYNVATVAEARPLADSDPAVEAGLIRVELKPWWGPAKLETLLAPEAK
jgi:uncharacterized protein YciI